MLARQHRHRDVVGEADALAAGDADHPLERHAGGLHHAHRLVAADERGAGVGHDPLGAVEVVEVGVADDDPVALVDVVGGQPGARRALGAVDVGVEEDGQPAGAQPERRAPVPVQRGHRRNVPLDRAEPGTLGRSWDGGGSYSRPAGEPAPIRPSRERM